MTYPRVPHSHVVPAGYLRAWERDGQIVLRRSGTEAKKLVALRDAGVRRNFYRRTRPETGEITYDAEWSLAQLENVALPIVANLAARWPLTREEKGKVGQLVGTQFVRGPAYKRWFERQIEVPIAELNADPQAFAVPAPGRTAQEAIDQAAVALRSDSYRIARMLKASRIAATVICSMHWTLVAFPKARLATSDDPVVIWPLRRGTAVPTANDPEAGLIESTELIFPIGPRHLLLMTWLYDEDARTPQVGLGQHAMTANAFVVANASAQWFHAPGDTPWRATGPRRPLSDALLRDYNRERAAASPRRAKAEILARQEAEAPLSSDPLSVVSLGSDAVDDETPRA